LKLIDIKNIKILNEYKDPLLLYSLMFVLFLIISTVTFPAMGMWQLIDAEKLVDGAIFYKNVRTVIPPAFYLEFIPFVKIGIKSILFYRILGVALISLTFVTFYLLLKKKTSLLSSLYITLLTFSVYILTPWEIINSYSYIACILVLLSLSQLYLNRYLSFYLAGLATSFKVTIGGSVLIGLLINFLLNKIIKKRTISEGQSKVYLSSFYILFGFLTPFILLMLFGIKFDVSSLSNLIFSGESKGGFYQSLLHPLRSYVNFLNILFESSLPNGSMGLIYFIKFPSTLTCISLLLGFSWIVSLIFYFFTSFQFIIKGRYNRILYYFPILISLFGASYASAMSSYLKSDDILLLSTLFFFIYKYIDKGLRGSLFFLSFILPMLLMSIVLVSTSNYSNLLTIILASILFLLICREISTRTLVILVLMYAFTIKLLVPLAWWETNISGRHIKKITQLGFFATPFYSSFTDKLYFIKNYSINHNIPLTVYSFPTSTLPYHVFNYLPEWNFTIHHADVFPVSQVANEFSILKKVNPSYIVISKWSPDKIQDLDREFSPNGVSSQHVMMNLVDGMLENHYVLCSKINYVQGQDLYNHPIEIYVNRSLLIKRNYIFDDLCK